VRNYKLITQQQAFYVSFDVCIVCFHNLLRELLREQRNYHQFQASSEKAHSSLLRIASDARSLETKSSLDVIRQ